MGDYAAPATAAGRAGKAVTSPSWWGPRLLRRSDGTEEVRQDKSYTAEPERPTPRLRRAPYIDFIAPDPGPVLTCKEPR